MIVQSLCPYFQKKAPFLVHLDCAIACTITFVKFACATACAITFLNSFVQLLCSKKFFHKIVSSDVPHIQGTSALGCSTLLLILFCIKIQNKLQILPLRSVICPRVTEFALKLRINSQCLSQSESGNFSQCVITTAISVICPGLQNLPSNYV